MNIDFSKPTDIFSVISTVISVLAFFRPEITALYQRLFKKLELSYIPDGYIYLFFNSSGPYFRLYSSIEAKNQETVLKKIDVSVCRNLDGRRLNLKWSNFVMPYYQQTPNGLTSGMEVAHPLTIEKNKMQPLFIEFGKEYVATDSLDVDYYQKIKEIKASSQNYEEAYNKLIKTTEYSRFRERLENEKFWLSGSYSLKVYIYHDNMQKKEFSYNFVLDSVMCERFGGNVEEALVAHLKQYYSKELYFFVPTIVLNEDNNN
jgi:hypothetical protein